MSGAGATVTISWFSMLVFFLMGKRKAPGLGAEGQLGIL